MTCGDDQHFDNIYLCGLVGVGGNSCFIISHTLGCTIYFL
jgi:hypothetical protein